jgi:hypothetical protein
MRADLGCDHLIHRSADPDLIRIEADRRSREQVHPAQMRTRGDRRGLVEEALDEDHVLAMRHHGQRRWTELHVRANALGPPLGRLDAVREEDDPEPQRRRGRLDGFDRLSEHRQRFHPGQRQRNSHASKEVTP